MCFPPECISYSWYSLKAAEKLHFDGSGLILRHVHPGMKMDTWNELRNAPLFGYGLFLDVALNIAEQGINKFNTQNVSVQSRIGPQHQQKPKYCYKPYEKKDAKPMVQPSASQQPWRQFGSRGRGHGRGSTNQHFSKYARIMNDNHCKDPQVQLDLNMMGQNKSSQNISRTVYLRTAVIHVPIVVGPGQLQKKGLSPDHCRTEIKHAKSVSFVSPCLSVPPVPSAPNVAESFWETWLSLGSNPPVISVLKEGYSLPFKMRPPLTRSPMIISGYANPRKNNSFKEALRSLIAKEVVEKVVVGSSLAFYNRLFIVPKLNNKWFPNH